MTGRYFIATRYKITGDCVIASRKFDVTDDVVAVVNPYRLAKAKKVSAPAPAGGGAR